jgi:predicted MPP superfamily phosphohydrolase
MKKAGCAPILVGVCSVSLLFTLGYGVVDKQRVVIVGQQVEIQGLPEELAGFTLLQSSDLHGKYFGAAQESLLAKINQADYDMLATTGDISDGYVLDSQPFWDLLDGIQNKEHTFYVGGNTGPWGLETFHGGLTADILTPDGKELEARGIHSLDKRNSIQLGESRIWVGEFWLVDLTDPALQCRVFQAKAGRSCTLTSTKSFFQSAVEYSQQLIADLAKIGPSDTQIGITHNPFSIDSVSDMPKIDPSYDLVLTGHYHAGPICLPLIGTNCILDGASEIRGFFPEQDKVSGLRDWGDFQQYVSRGLGSSSSIDLLNLGLFDAPETNLITLRAAEMNEVEN